MGVKYTLHNGATIEVSNAPFASGGEADIYEIVSPNSYTGQVLKVYNIDKRSKEKEEKLKHLIANRPNLVVTNGHHSVIWPVHLAFQSSSFVGYTMQRASGIKLELLCHPKLPKNIPKEFEKFSFQVPGVISARLKLCYNISAALSQIHSFGSYVLVDMKPENVMVKPDGLISIVDFDSIEVTHGSRLLFPAQVITPEYTPPEYYENTSKLEKTLIEETWDRFSVAVIFYRLLFGIHPFTATLKPPHDNVTMVSDIIKLGYLPVGNSKEKFRIVPAPHANFSKVENQIQNLFINALEKGKHNPLIRPSADDWCRILSPDPGITLNRKVPTLLLSCFAASNSSSLMSITKVPEILFSKPEYIFPDKAQNIIEKIISIFHKNEKDKVWHSIAHLQDKIDVQMRKIESLKKDFISAYNLCVQQQNEFLEIEEKNITKLIGHFKLLASSIDKKAQDLFTIEINKYRVYQETYLKEYYFLESKIKEQFDILVKQFEFDSNKQMNQLNIDLAKLNLRENEQINSLDTEMKVKLTKIKIAIQNLEKEYANKINSDYKLRLFNIEVKRNEIAERELKLMSDALEKYQSNYSHKLLSQYKIYDSRYEIFTDNHGNPDSIARTLTQYGIVTAADIKGVDSTGRILTANSTWVKIPNIATTRAGNLNAWRKRKERIGQSLIPQALPYSEEVKVKAMLYADIRKVDEQEKLLKAEIAQQKNKMLQLTKDIDDAKKEEQSTIDEFEQKKKAVVQKFVVEKDKHENIKRQFYANYQTTKQKRQKEFEENTRLYKEQTERIQREKATFFDTTKKQFDVEHENLKSELHTLDSNYQTEVNKINNSTSADLQVLSIEYENNYAKMMALMKMEIDKFNVFSQDLVSIQSKYKSIR